ncbi:MAG: hypothetical protein KKF01_01145 [Proteobacteria bacterium]|nr:hypothetical protein [Pseudomonadota bacterium]MBU4121894.1 hypothetical protein [Pseudomonadota bacterium]
MRAFFAKYRARAGWFLLICLTGYAVAEPSLPAALAERRVPLFYGRRPPRAGIARGGPAGDRIPAAAKKTPKG